MGNGHDVGDARDHPAEPVGPAGEEPGPGAEDVTGEIGEVLVVGVAQQQFAHRTHHEEEHETDDHVHEDDGGPGDRDGLSRTHEQAGADGPADGDQLDVAVGEPSLKMGRGTVVAHAVAFQMGAGASVAGPGRFAPSSPRHSSPRPPFPSRCTCRRAHGRRAANAGPDGAGSRVRPAGTPMRNRAVAWVGSILEELPNRVRAMPHCSWILPNLLTYLRVSIPTREGGTCSFGERGFHRAAFQIRLFVAVRGPESFLGRNCSYGARPWCERVSPATC